MKKLWHLVFAFAAAAAPPDGVEFFEKEIRPLLAEKCLACHSTKAKTQFANLSLDTAAGIAKGGDAGPVIVAGKPAESRLMRAVRGELPAKMPPGGKLPDTQIGALARWIEMGAPMPSEPAATGPVPAQSFDLQKRRREHWAWQPVKTHPVPEPAMSGWAAGPVDRFLLARMEKEGLRPARAADRRTWLRRLSFDLTGLPPSPAELDAFEADRSPDAHRKQINRLLDSPRFGEHWARHWMDLFRYAESHGSEGDPDTPRAWRYRDYLIRSLNADVPYDQLVREHIAGDLLPNPRRNERDRVNESMLATAHWRMVEHGFQPVDPWEDRVKWTDNQVEVFGKAFQGLTIACARCHDHKFDAISQRDYYALFGIIANARPTQAPVDLPEDLGRNLEDLRQAKSAVKTAAARAWSESARSLPARMSGFDFEVEHEAAACEPGTPLHLWWQLRKLTGQTFRDAWSKLAEKSRAEAESRSRHNEARLKRVWDLRGPAAKDWIVRGVNTSSTASAPGEFWILPDGKKSIGAVYPAGIYTNLISNKHPGVITSPRFKIDTDYVSFELLGGNHSYAQLIIENYAVPRGGIYGQRTVPRSDTMQWRTWDTTFWKGFTAYIEFATYDDVTHATGDYEGGGMKQPTDGRSWIGARMVAFHNEKGAPKSEWLPVDMLFEGPAPDSAEALARRYSDRILEAVKAWESGSITDRQAEFLNYFISSGVLTEPPAELISRYRMLEAAVPVPRRAPAVLEEGGPDQRLLVRGNHKNPGPEVPKRYLEALGSSTPYGDARAARLRLAEAVASPSNPLTARVMVNRIWRYLYGAGLVRTVDNFGKLGEAPSHPELLDWLAERFVQDGWSIKKMIRLLADSSAYRMESVTSPEAAAKDPANRLLSRMPVKRLESEAIRDSILWVSGQLDGTMYGESIDTYYAHDTGKTKGDKPKGPLDGAGRRSIYMEVRRNVTNPFLEVFDLPKATTTRGERDLTNVPAQSLAFLNSPFVIDQAAKWAANTSGEPGARIEEMYLRAFSRKPEPAERDRAESFLARLRKEHAAKSGPDRAAWADFAQALFNLKEFIYIR